MIEHRKNKRLPDWGLLATRQTQESSSFSLEVQLDGVRGELSEMRGGGIQHSPDTERQTEGSNCASDMRVLSSGAECWRQQTLDGEVSLWNLREGSMVELVTEGIEL